MTPHELNVHIEEYFEAKAEDIKEQRFQAYMIAKMPLMKKFPRTFEEAFGYKAEKQEKKPQTDEEMFQEMIRLNKALGGTVY